MDRPAMADCLVNAYGTSILEMGVIVVYGDVQPPVGDDAALIERVALLGVQRDVSRKGQKNSVPENQPHSRTHLLGIRPDRLSSSRTPPNSLGMGSRRSPRQVGDRMERPPPDQPAQMVHHIFHADAAGDLVPKAVQHLR